MNDLDVAHLSVLECERIRREIDEVRLILHAHWVSYNHIGMLAIDYDEWDMLAMRLMDLHERYPTFVHSGYEAEYFYDWDTDHMFDLRVTPFIYDVAMKMVEREEFLAGDAYFRMEVA